MKIRETARIAKAAKVEAAFGSWPAESLIQAAKVVELAVGLWMRLPRNTGRLACIIYDMKCV